jgi:hypothetical protein
MDGNIMWTYRQEPADGACQQTVGFRGNMVMSFLTHNRRSGI